MYSSFSSQAGPTGPGGGSPIPQFGNSGRRPPSPSPPPTTPPFSDSAPLRTPSSGHEALGQPHSTHLTFQSSHPGASHSYRSAGVNRSPESLPSWNGGQRSLLKNNDSQVHQRPSAVTSFVVSRNSGTSVTAKVARFQDTRGTRSPPFVSKDVNTRNSTQGVPRSHLVPPRTQSPPSASYNYHPVEDFDCFGGVEGHLPRTRSPPLGSYNHHPVEDFDRSGGVEEHAFSSSGLNRQSKLIDDHPGLQAHQEPSRVSPFVGSFDSGRRTPVNYDDVQVLKRTRPSVSPIGSNASSNAVFSTHDSRSIRANSYATEDGTEREMQAKAKRLARFKVELSKSPQSSIDIAEQGVSAIRPEQSNIDGEQISCI
ncbi:hypothetical protein M0R45_020737 [Rubus argutus]|uniref:Uncharacterized protein n=1 Tax=Rubus argutus TaxID=59490 RepID=A0AAW1XCS8_RUBAR